MPNQIVITQDGIDQINETFPIVLKSDSIEIRRGIAAFSDKFTISFKYKGHTVACLPASAILDGDSLTLDVAEFSINVTSVI